MCYYVKYMYKEIVSESMTDMYHLNKLLSCTDKTIQYYSNNKRNDKLCFFLEYVTLCMIPLQV